ACSDGRIDGGGKHMAAGIPIDVTGVFTSGDDGTADPAHGLAEGDDEIVDLVEHAVHSGGAAAMGAAQQEGMSFIHQRLGSIGLCQRYNLVESAESAIMAEHAFAAHQDAFGVGADFL